MDPTSASSPDNEKIVEKNEVNIEPVKNGTAEFVRDEPPAKSLKVRKWIVLIASFMCNGLIFGLINSVGVIYEELQENLESQNVTDAATKASLVGSLSIGTTFMLSPVAGILTDQIGIRTTTFLGGFLATCGLLASSFFSTTVEVLYFTYSIVLGVGGSLAYTPSLVILGHYFKEDLGLANGFVTTGSSVFTMALPFALQALIENFKLKGCFLFLAGTVSLLMLCALVFKPVHSTAPPPKKRHNHTLKAKLSTIINVDIWKKKKFIIWTIALPVSLFGYFVIFVHLVKYVSINFEEYDGKILIQCIAVTSLVGRLASGKVADFPSVNRIFLQQISFVSLGVLTMLIAAANDYYVLVAITLAIGIFDGCFVSLIGPVAFDICGKEGASQAIGFVLGLSSIPMTLGPPLVGFIYDNTKSYTISFILSGVMFLVGAVLMTLIRFVNGEEKTKVPDPAAEPLKSGGESNENDIKQKPVILEMNGDPRPSPPTYKEATEGGLSNGVVNHIDPSKKAVLIIDNGADPQQKVNVNIT